MSRAQQAMAHKPTLRQITRANAAMQPPDNPAKLIREGNVGPLYYRVYSPSWLLGGAAFFMCADSVGDDGKPQLGRDAEAGTMAEVEAWIKGLEGGDAEPAGER